MGFFRDSFNRISWKFYFSLVFIQYLLELLIRWTLASSTICISFQTYGLHKWPNCLTFKWEIYLGNSTKFDKIQPFLSCIKELKQKVNGFIQLHVRFVYNGYWLLHWALAAFTKLLAQNSANFNRSFRWLFMVKRFSVLGMHNNSISTPFFCVPFAPHSNHGQIKCFISNIIANNALFQSLRFNFRASHLDFFVIQSFFFSFTEFYAFENILLKI